MYRCASRPWNISISFAFQYCCFTNFFVGQLFCTKEVFYLFSNLLPTWSLIFYLSHLRFCSLHLFRTLIQDLFFRQGKITPQPFSDPSRRTMNQAHRQSKNNYLFPIQDQSNVQAFFAAYQKLIDTEYTGSILRKRPINLQLFPYSSTIKDA